MNDIRWFALPTHVLALAGLTSLTTFAACISIGEPGETGGSGADIGTGGSGAGGPVTVSPAEADVLTCSTLQLTAGDKPVDGAWSMAKGSAGSVDEGGLYTAPIAVPDPADDVVSYESARGQASSTIHLATAHPGKGVVIADGHIDAQSIWERTVVASGSHVLAVYPEPSNGQGSQSVQLAKSDDSGATFTTLPAFAGPTIECVSAAFDAGNPDIVYMVYYQGTPGHTFVHLAVSEDGGATFGPDEYVLGDTILGDLGMYCPDVVSPLPDHVLVTAPMQSGDDQTNWVGTYYDANRGMGFGVGAGSGVANYYASFADTNIAQLVPCPIESGGESRSPRAFSDALGRVCTSYAVNGDPTFCNGGTVDVLVQCSDDGGATFGAPIVLGSTSGKPYPTGAFSQGGKVAVAWYDESSGKGEVAVAFSTDGGATFGSKKLYPLGEMVVGDNLVAGDPVVVWEGEILWLAMTVDPSNFPYLLVDKTCDVGETWSGAVRLTEPATEIYRFGSLISTERGVSLFELGVVESSLSKVVPLTP